MAVKCERCNSNCDGSFGSGRFCSRICANKRIHSLETKEKIKKSIVKRKGVIKCIEEKTCPICFKKFIFSYTKNTIKYLKGVFCSKKCSIENSTMAFVEKQKDFSDKKKNEIKIKKSESMKSYFFNGGKVHGGTTKWYEYKDIKVHGTYELRTCKILDQWKEEGKIKDWEYTSDRFDYVGVDGKLHAYLLDFKVFDHNNEFYYIETKGYEKENDPLKWKAVEDKGYKIEIWFKETIKKYEN